MGRDALGKRLESVAGCSPSRRHVRRSCTMLLPNEAPWLGAEDDAPVSPYLYSGVQCFSEKQDALHPHRHGKITAQWCAVLLREAGCSAPT